MKPGGFAKGLLPIAEKGYVVSRISNKFILWALIIFVLALGVRFFVFSAFPTPDFDQGDSAGYIRIAQSLTNGDGFSLDGENPTALRTPVYPLFIAVFRIVFGGSLESVILFQTAIDSFSCVLIFFLAMQWLGERASRYCGLFAACYLPMAFWCSYILTETIFTFLFLLALLILSRRKNSSHYFFAGLILGLATLTRPNGIIIAAILTIWIIFSGLSATHKRLSVKFAAVYLIGFFLVMAPWVVRNYIAFEKFIPTSTVTGITFYNSYLYADNGLGFNQLQAQHEYVNSMDSEAERSSELIRITLKYMSDNWLKVIGDIPLKFGLLFYPFDMQWLNEKIPFKYNFFWSAVGLLFAYWIAISTKQQLWQFSLLILPVLGLFVTTILFYGSPRLRAPFDPIFLILATAGYDHLRRLPHKYYYYAIFILINATFFCLAEMDGFRSQLRMLLPW